MPVTSKKLKYQCIKDEIIASIQNRTLAENQCFPSERELCELFGASRVTMRKAIAELESEGIIYRVRGKGTFVKNQNKLTQTLTKLTGFTEDMQMRGMNAESRILLTECVLSTAEIAENLKIRQGDPAILLRRLRLADGVPMAIETIYLNDRVFHPVLEEYTGGSFYEFMHERFGIVPYRAVQSIEVVKLLRWEADLLGNPNLDMALLMHRQTCDENDQPIEYVVSKYRGDKYKFHIELYNMQNVAP